jgi:hypothetical protein
VDAPLPTSDALIRPWRTATLVASLIAAVELVLLVGAAVVFLAKPLAHAVRHHAEAAAFAPAKKHPAPVVRHVAKVTAPKLSRRQTRVFVFNGNGRNGAASAEAATLERLGYRVPGTGNASRQDYATTVIMFRRGYEAEARRLARDMHVQVVGPLDGVRTSSLKGGQLAVVLGAAS